MEKKKKILADAEFSDFSTLYTQTKPATAFYIFYFI